MYHLSNVRFPGDAHPMDEQQLRMGDSWPWGGSNVAFAEQPRESDASQTATNGTFPDMSDLYPALPFSDEYYVPGDEHTAPHSHAQESDIAPTPDMALPFHGLNFNFPAEMHVPDAAALVDSYPDIDIREEHIHDCLTRSWTTQGSINVSSSGATIGAYEPAGMPAVTPDALGGIPGEPVEEAEFALRVLSPANSPKDDVAPDRTCSFGGPKCSHTFADAAPRSIKEHLEVEHPTQLLFNKGKVQCRWGGCEKWLTGMHNLTKHIAAVHLKSSQVCCPQCGAACSRRDSLDRHMRRNCHTTKSTAEMHA